MRRTDDQFNIRMPDGMRALLAERARENFRSMNSEIVMILANALGDESKAATGEKFGDRAPAAVNHSTALPGGSATHG